MSCMCALVFGSLTIVHESAFVRKTLLVGVSTPNDVSLLAGYDATHSRS